jgi:hypothetical protein
MSNFSICGQVAANTGVVDCDVVRGVPASIIVGSGSFTSSDYATSASFKAAFLTKIKKANTASDKLFPFPVIQGNTDKTVAAKEGNLGYGLRVGLLRSKPGYEFDVLAGSSLEKKLMKFNNKTIPVYVFDDSSNIWAVVNSAGVFSGALYLLTVEPRGFGDGQNPKTTKVSISIIDSKDFTENSKFASTDFSTSDLVGLLDAVLFQTVAPTTNVYKIGAKILTDTINSYVDVHANSIYASGLATASMWTAKTGATFATTLAITTVTDDVVNGGWTVTFDSTAWTALASGSQVKLNFTDPATLDTAGITGIEGNYMIITKP